MNLQTVIKKFDKRLSRIERRIKTTPVTQEWISQAEAMKLTGLKAKSFQTMRKDGTLKEFRCLKSRRGFQYRKQDIDNLFITIKN